MESKASNSGLEGMGVAASSLRQGLLDASSGRAGRVDADISLAQGLVAVSSAQGLADSSLSRGLFTPTSGLGVGDACSSGVRSSWLIVTGRDAATSEGR